MSGKRELVSGDSRQGALPSPGGRLWIQVVLAMAAAVVAFGVALSFSPGSGTGWVRIVGMALHALILGGVVFLWLPLSGWLAGWLRLSPGGAEGMTVLLLGLVVAGAEYGFLRGPNWWACTAIAVLGMLAGWAMRIPPPESNAHHVP